MDAARKAKLGQKWVCFACYSKFYDMGRAEPLCPKCGKDQRESPALAPKPRSRRGRAKPVEEVVAAPLEADPPERRSNGRRRDPEEVDEDIDGLDDIDDDLGLSGDDEDFALDEEAAL